MLYKYLQGNDINEGRELFAVSKDGRISSSVLKLWKEIFRLDHAWQEGKGWWRQVGRRISLIKSSREGAGEAVTACAVWTRGGPGCSHPRGFAEGSASPNKSLF